MPATTTNDIPALTFAIPNSVRICSDKVIETDQYI